MSRKHFIGIAKALANIRPDKDDLHYPRWFMSVQAVATVCLSANSEFNRGKFVDACETYPRGSA